MSELSELLERLKVENLFSYIKYGSGSFKEAENEYQDRIKESYEIYFAELKKLFPDIDADDDQLFGIAARLVSVHEDTYFAMGVMAGLQLYRNLEQEYQKCRSEDLQALLDKAKILT